MSTHDDRNPNFYRGLTPLVGESPSHAEIFEMGLEYSKVTEAEKGCPVHEETPWPAAGEEGLRFREFVETKYEERLQLASELMGCVATGLGKPADFFDNWYKEDTCSTFSANHFVPRSRGLVS